MDAHSEREDGASRAPSDGSSSQEQGGEAPPEARTAHEADRVSEAKTQVSRQKPPSPAVTGAPLEEGILWERLPGQNLEHYHIHDRVAIGGMGAIFRAEDMRLKRQVAVKVLPIDLSEDPATVKRFQQEARAAAQLDHDNIARVYYVGEDQGYHFIVFEYVAGTNVQELLTQHGCLPLPQALDCVLQVAHALVHASSRGVVHRDIKPSNLIVTPTGRIKLVDMGLARQFERRKDTDLTHTGVTMGTFDYISPEQARDPRRADTRSDIYSLGCTLYHMVTGRAPFPKGTVLQKLLQHQAEPPPDPRQLNPEAPRSLRRVIMKMMAKEPDGRYQTADALVADLEKVQAELARGEQLNRSPLAPGSAPSPFDIQIPLLGKSALLALPVVLVLIVVLGLTFFSETGRPPGTPPTVGPAPPVRGDDPGTVVVTPPTREIHTTEPPPKEVLELAKAGKPKPAGVPEADPAAPEAAHPASVGAHQAAPPVEPVAPDPETRSVRTVAELRDAVDRLPKGSTIVLTEPEYLIQPASPEGEPVGLTVRNKKLTLKSGLPDGAKPVLLMRHSASAAHAGRPWRLLEVLTSEVTLQGLAFRLELEQDAAMRAVDCLGSIVTIDACVFTPKMPGNMASQITSILARGAVLKQADTGEENPCPYNVTLTKTFLRGGLRAIRTRKGSGTISLQHCILAGYSEPFVLGGTDQDDLSVQLRHVTCFAQQAPVFRVNALNTVTLDVRMSVFKRTQRSGQPFLLTEGVDRLDLERLRWQGDYNCYHQFKTFLQVVRDGQILAEARSRTEWDEMFGNTEGHSSDADPRHLPAGTDAHGNFGLNAFRLAADSTFRAAGPNREPLGAVLGEARPEPAPPAPEEPSLPEFAEGVEPYQEDEGWEARMRPGEDVTQGVGQDDTVTEVAGSQPVQVARVGRTPGPDTQVSPAGSRTPPRRAAPTNAGPQARAAAGSPMGAEPGTPILAPLIVDPAAHYKSLGAACLDAKKGQAILIRTNGPLEEHDIGVQNTDVIVRADKGFIPVVRLVPRGPIVDDQRAQLFRIFGASLTVVGVHFEFVWPSDAKRLNWAFIHAVESNVKLERCSFSYRHPGDVPCAVIATERRGREQGEPFVGSSPTRRFRLRDCFVRGPTELIDIRDYANVRIELEQCVCLIPGRLAVSRGSSQLSDEGVELRMDHCTVAVSDSLLAIDIPAAERFLVEARVSVSNSVVRGPTNESAGLLFVRAMTSQQRAVEKVIWRGEYNLYARVATYFRFTPIDSEGEVPIAWDWAEWAKRWADREIHALQLDDVGFVGGPLDLRQAAATPLKNLAFGPHSLAAVAVGSDGNLIGADTSRFGPQRGVAEPTTTEPTTTQPDAEQPIPEVSLDD